MGLYIEYKYGMAALNKQMSAIENRDPPQKRGHFNITGFENP